ncbi:MAG: hypothetical protein MI744_10080, partial [Pseudomonadales bacterium]|nr:hypothetical protein [Pseudomonadales bacterium]
MDQLSGVILVPISQNGERKFERSFHTHSFYACSYNGFVAEIKYNLNSNDWQPFIVGHGAEHIPVKQFWLCWKGTGREGDYAYIHVSGDPHAAVKSKTVAYAASAAGSMYVANTPDNPVIVSDGLPKAHSG